MNHPDQATDSQDSKLEPTMPRQSHIANKPNEIMQGPEQVDSKAISCNLRKGKWTVEEEMYTNKVIELFKLGILPLGDKDRSGHTTLRAYLSEKLSCDPMRITKKYTGTSCLGKRVYHQGDLNEHSNEVKRLRLELQILEDSFRLKLDQANRKKANGSRTLPERRSIISTPAIDALFMSKAPSTQVNPGPGWVAVYPSNHDNGMVHLPPYTQLMHLGGERYNPAAGAPAIGYPNNISWSNIAAHNHHLPMFQQQREQQMYFKHEEEQAKHHSEHSKQQEHRHQQRVKSETKATQVAKAKETSSSRQYDGVEQNQYAGSARNALAAASWVGQTVLYPNSGNCDISEIRHSIDNSQPISDASFTIINGTGTCSGGNGNDSSGCRQVHPPTGDSAGSRGSGADRSNISLNADSSNPILNPFPSFCSSSSSKSSSSVSSSMPDASAARYVEHGDRAVAQSHTLISSKPANSGASLSASPAPSIENERDSTQARFVFGGGHHNQDFHHHQLHLQRDQQMHQPYHQLPQERKRARDDDIDEPQDHSSHKLQHTSSTDLNDAHSLSTQSSSVPSPSKSASASASSDLNSALHVLPANPAVTFPQYNSDTSATVHSVALDALRPSFCSTTADAPSAFSSSSGSCDYGEDNAAAAASSLLGFFQQAQSKSQRDLQAFLESAQIANLSSSINGKSGGGEGGDYSSSGGLIRQRSSCAIAGALGGKRVEGGGGRLVDEYGPLTALSPIHSHRSSEKLMQMG